MLDELVNIPEGAINLHLFALKQDLNKKWQAFVGYYTKQGDFHFIQIPVDKNLIENLNYNINV